MFARRALLGALLLATIAAVLTTTVAETDSAINARRYEGNLIANGYTTYLITAGPNATLTPANCLSLHVIDGVRAVLWVTQAQNEHLFSPAGPVVAASTAGGDIGDYLAITDPAAAHAWTGQQTLIDPANQAIPPGRATTALRITGGQTGTSGFGSVLGHNALVAHLTSLGQGFQGNAIILGTPPASAQSCDIVVATAHRDQAAANIRIAFPASAGFGQQWVLSNADQFISPETQFDQRTSQWFWLAATVVVVALWSLYLRLRRPETALYAVAGLRTGQLTQLVLAELLMLLATAAALVTVVYGLSCLRAHTTSADAWVGIAAALRSLIAGGLAGTVLTLAHAHHARVESLSSLKDR